MVAEPNLMEVVSSAKLVNRIGQMILDGKRDANDAKAVLQIMRNHADFRQRLTTGPILDDSKIREELVLWQQFDKKFFPDVNVGNYTNLRIPMLAQGFNWPIVTARGITNNQLVARAKKEFGVYQYIDDLASIRSDRNAVSSSYVVLVRDRIEADEELKNKSAETLIEESIPGIAFHERFRLEFFCWFKTGKHLYIVNATICTCSRSTDGRVPCVDWRGASGWLSVSWLCHPQDAFGALRSRAVVS